MALTILKRPGPNICIDVEYLLQSCELSRVSVTDFLLNTDLGWLASTNLDVLTQKSNLLHDSVCMEGFWLESFHQGRN